jgi:NAD-dependent dihydropyrimidine dehydrogenase PreA subunit
MHAEARMTAALKIIVGCLGGLDKRKIHNKKYFANILRLNEMIKPDFYVVDGLIAMEGNGPSAGTPFKMDLILAGSDPYLLDLTISKLIGYEFDDVPYLKLARKLGKIKNEHYDYVNNLDLDHIRKSLKKPNPSIFFVILNHPRTFRFFTWLRYSPLFDWFFSSKVIIKLLHFLHFTQDLYINEEADIKRITLDEENCSGCKECAKYCPMGLNLPEQLGAEEVCIKCLYCYSVCPKKAIQIEGKLGFLTSQITKYDKIIREMITNDMSARNYHV